MAKPQGNLGGGGGSKGKSAGGAAVAASAGNLTPPPGTDARVVKDDQAAAVGGGAASPPAKGEEAILLEIDSIGEAELDLPELPGEVEKKDAADVAADKVESFRTVAGVTESLALRAEKAHSLAKKTGKKGLIEKAAELFKRLRERADEAKEAAAEAVEAADGVTGRAREQAKKDEAGLKSRRLSIFQHASDSLNATKVAAAKEFEAVQQAIIEKRSQLETLNAELSHAFHHGEWDRFDEAVEKVKAAAAEYAGK